jgi:hypothetical protein
MRYVEMDTPIGAKPLVAENRCVEAFQQAAGFNDALIAGEEPELCVRLRQKDWKIFRLDAEMTLH